MKTRAVFTQKLSGSGIELGALHIKNPLHSRMKVTYVDRLPVAELRKHYPELKDFDFVEADVIDDAETLVTIPDSSQDFVISTHVIEHLRSPILALKTWLRVMRPGGLLYLVVPDKRRTFDKFRLRTTLEHLILDYENPDVERDRHHFYDYALNVNKKFFGRDVDPAEEATKLLEQGYSIHYHCWLPCDVREMLEYFQRKITQVDILCGPFMERGGSECHFLIQKPEEA